MTSVNVTTTKNTVTVNGETRVVTVKTQGPQGPAFSDGDKGDVTVSNNGTAISINNDSITSAKIADGAIVNADINASAAIALSKLATGALPTAITVTSANISDLSIVDADISGSAAISLSKLATGALPTAITVTSANISDLSIVNADINASAAIAGTKISPDFGSQNIVTTGTGATGALGVTGNITVSGTVDGRDVATDGTKLDGIETAATADQTAAEIKTLLQSDKLTVNEIADDAVTNAKIADNSVANAQLQDGVINTAKLATNSVSNVKIQDGVVTSAKIADGTIVNADVNASAAIAGTKISPNFGSQNITTTGGIFSNDVTIASNAPKLIFTDNDNNSDFRMQVNSGTFLIEDTTNSNVDRFQIASDGTVDVFGNLDVGAGVDVTGNITVTGTVDGVDVATRDTLFGGLTSSSGVLTNGVTATTQSASDNSTKVATTAYTDTAIANLVDSAPGTLNTLNELASALGDDANFSTTVTNSIATKLPLAGGQITGNITCSGSQTFDGRDLSVDGTKLDGIESGATADQTASEIKSLLSDQDITTTGNFGAANVNITDNSPSLIFTDSANDSDFRIRVQSGVLKLRDDTNSANRLEINSSGVVTIPGNTDFGAGIDVTGNITVSGTVDGRDLATDGTKLDGIESNATADQTASEIVALVADQTIAPSTIDMEDNERIKLGTGDDLQIYHDGSNSNVRHQGTGDLNLTTTTGNIQLLGSSDKMLVADKDGAVELYFDNSKKLETTSTGVKVQNTGASALLLFQKDTDALGYLESQTSKIVFGSSNNHPVTITQNSGTALNIDTSKNIQIPNDNAKLQIGAGQDLKIAHTGSESYIQNSTGALQIQADDLKLFDHSTAHLYFRGQTNSSVELYFDNSKKLETTSGGVDVDGSVTADDIITAGALLHEGDTDTLVHFSAADTIDLKTSGTERLRINNSGVSLFGVLYTNGRNISLGDSSSATDDRITFGESQDLQIYHNGTNSFVENSTGYIQVNSTTGVYIKTGNEHAIDAVINDAVKLYYDGSKKFETTSSGATVTGRLVSDGLDVGDSESIRFGTGYDMNMYHDGTNGVINNGTGSFYIFGGNGNIFLRPSTDDEHGLIVKPNADVELYYDGSKKLETTSTGISVTGNIAVSGTVDGVDVAALSASVSGFLSNIVEDTSPQLGSDLQSNGHDIDFADNDKAIFGTGSDFEIYHNGFTSIIGSASHTIGYYSGVNHHFLNANGTETSAKFTTNGSAELYYDNSKKLETTSSGGLVTGQLLASSGFKVNDGVHITLGTDNDFKLYHDGSNAAWLNTTGNNYLYGSGGNFFIRPVNGESSIDAIANGAVNLYFDNAKKFETYADGLKFYGHQIGQTAGAYLQVAGANSNAFAIGMTSGADQPSGSDNHLQFHHWNNSSWDKVFYVHRDFINIPDGKKIGFGDGNDLQIYHDGTNSFINNFTGNLEIRAKTGEPGVKLVPNGNTELYFDGSSKFQTTTNGAHCSGILESSNQGNILSQTNSALILKSSTNAAMRCNFLLEDDFPSGRGSLAINVTEAGVTNDRDLLLNRSGGRVGVRCTPTVDFEVSGTSLFNNNVRHVDNAKALFGVSDDLQIYHNGTHSFIDNSTGSLFIRGATVKIRNLAGTEDYIEAFENGAVNLYYDNSVKLATINGGISVTGGVNTTGASSFNGDIFFGDNKKTIFGAGSDLQIYHDGTDSYIQNTTGTLRINNDGTDLVISTDNNIHIRTNGTEEAVKAIANGAVELYHDNSKKFETTSYGAKVTGRLAATTSFTGSDNVKLILGDSDDLQIYHDGTHSYIDNSTNVLFIRNTTATKAIYSRSDELLLQSYTGNENYIIATLNGSVELYYDGTKRLDTHSSGITVHTSSGVDLKIGTNDSIFRTDANMAGIHFSTTSVLPTNNSGSVVNNSIDLGSANYRWQNIYTNDLNLSNEGGSNDVDSTWGSFTIQEGAEDLFLINRRNGKKYKFNLTEVS